MDGGAVMTRELRTNAPRTMREAFGRDFRFEDDAPLLKWPRPELLFWLPVAIGCLWLMPQEQVDPTLELRRHGCEPVGQAVSGEHIWQCRGGELRVSKVGGDAL